MYSTPALRLLQNVRLVISVDGDEGLGSLVVADIVEREAHQAVVRPLHVDVLSNHGFCIQKEVGRDLDVVFLCALSAAIFSVQSTCQKNAVLVI
jgi:hypothetical protein